MTNEEKAHRGNEAKRILENEIFQEVVASLDATYVQAWRNARTVEAREDAFRYVQLTNQFLTDLKAIIKDGQVSSHRIKELEGQKGGLLKAWANR